MYRNASARPGLVIRSQIPVPTSSSLHHNCYDFGNRSIVVAKLSHDIFQLPPLIFCLTIPTTKDKSPIAFTHHGKKKLKTESARY